MYFVFVFQAGNVDTADAAEVAVALDAPVLFDTAARMDPNAGPRPAAASSRLHSRGVYEALRR